MKTISLRRALFVTCRTRSAKCQFEQRSFPSRYRENFRLRTIYYNTAGLRCVSTLHKINSDVHQFCLRGAASVAKAWVGLSEAAKILGAHPATVRSWADRGELPSQRTPGGHR